MRYGHPIGRRVPDSVLVVHDLERGDRALMPILDLEQNSLDVAGH